MRVTNHAQVQRSMNQLGYQAALSAHNQQNSQHEVPAEVARGVVASPLERASQGASQPPQTNFFPSDSDTCNKGNVRSDLTRHRSLNMPTAGRSGRGNQDRCISTGTHHQSTTVIPSYHDLQLLFHHRHRMPMLRQSPTFKAKTDKSSVFAR